MIQTTRRQFLHSLGLSAAALPFLPALHRLRAAEVSPIQRIVFMFSPNGTIMPDFWPDQVGEVFSSSASSRRWSHSRIGCMTLKGISNKISGDGDGHMRGMSCLLTAIELNAGNIQGGSDRPAGWAKGISIDQEIRNFLQSKKETATRFGSLELGVQCRTAPIRGRAGLTPGTNQPVAPGQQSLRNLRQTLRPGEGRARTSAACSMT